MNDSPDLWILYEVCLRTDGNITYGFTRGPDKFQAMPSPTLHTPGMQNAETHMVGIRRNYE
jgi:hypothetical protein